MKCFGGVWNIVVSREGLSPSGIDRHAQDAFDRIMRTCLEVTLRVDDCT